MTIVREMLSWFLFVVMIINVCLLIWGYGVYRIDEYAKEVVDWQKKRKDEFVNEYDRE